MQTLERFQQGLTQSPAILHAESVEFDELVRKVRAARKLLLVSGAPAEPQLACADVITHFVKLLSSDDTRMQTSSASIWRLLRRFIEIENESTMLPALHWLHSSGTAWKSVRSCL